MPKKKKIRMTKTGKPAVDEFQEPVDPRRQPLANHSTDLKVFGRNRVCLSDFSSTNPSKTKECCIFKTTSVKLIFIRLSISSKQPSQLTKY
ncbi:death-associated protein 1 isoform X3 [Mycteria americana]|uniref:death-associated protein 1 isoform X3 n=1 Tax=Mycteria americana TaxID=33587 RepID=UPI003F58F7BF